MDQLLAVGFVLCIALAAVWAIRRRQGSHFTWPASRKTGQREVAVLERLPLTGQHTLHLVRVGNSTLLVGTHPMGIAFEATSPASFQDLLLQASRDRIGQGGAE
ncbi:flagellar biosynthetic protein FliO [Paludibaculum fermentans]|uniref:Flagellar biosynthetic protein FliO n=1 Tax=Paludibaculum fermentans TaxID=1473598 RepID=A0A7S7NQ09_PALFE|nr:flagellar biosynthetic protein FliO [Paludibaculum fermentans]QOY87589.1 flagellar biosynthetic protein FliO [Paludibaculum fermentans]